MSQLRYETLRALIRRAIRENYPAGAEYDSNAPWNQSEPNVEHGKSVPSNLKVIGGDEEEEFLISNGEKVYVISKITVTENPDFFRELVNTYGSVPYETEGPDEDGEPSYTYLWEDAELTTEDLISAAQDMINKGNIGSSDDYATGESFIYELTPELAEELWSNNSNLVTLPQVSNLIDYDSLKQRYPQSFE